ncbi:germination protein, Ger(x)C family [Acididesulfobacillus acetoxydans]|uniref:Germination protein, Ger(X)C n=1 Tax=Acididesulfobacillus acetoxydans TaxID=1561005 RepID=A0A8S0WG70_9FIRM|nr:Ger(x)C family spore germination protein [Acididesulfobacillus acetoxydans]CAA7601642.1 germination protein, Ger(x)C family [Acididesulfobacillus acetoxydans]CEJ07129.1 Germination protein, Ger(X)C [Acididesulfobacillus acetoxydans]
MRRTRRYLGLLLSLLLLLSAGGCWSRKDVEELGIVTLVGYDRIMRNGHEMWQESIRILSGMAPAQGGKPQGLSSETLFKGTGLTIQQAGTNLNLRTSRLPFYGDIVGAIIGEKAAEENLRDIVDLLLRHPQARPGTYILVCKGEAFNLMRSEPEMTKTLSKELNEMIEQRVCRLGVSFPVTLAQFAEWLLSPDRDAVASEVQPVYPRENTPKTVSQSLLVSGLAVFRGPKLVGFLNKEESLGTELIVHSLNRAQVAIPLPEDGRYFTYQVMSGRHKIIPSVQDGKVSYRVEIDVKGAVFDAAGHELSLQSAEHVEALAADKIRGIVLRAVQKAKDFRADYLGLSQELHRTDPAEWEEIQPQWRENFVEAPVDVEVKAQVLSSGSLGAKLPLKP